MTAEISLKQHPKIVLRPNILFLPYLPVFIILVIVIFDFILGSGLAGKLPSSPYQVFIYSLIFGNPHIIASALILIDKEYISFYGRAILIRTIIAGAIVAGILATFGVNAFYAFYYSWTIMHVNKQQLGIGKMFNRQFLSIYNYWIWSFIVVSIFIAIGIGFFKANTYIPLHLLRQLIIYGGLLTILSGVYILTKINKKIGQYYLLANIVLFAVTIICYLRGFSLFAILMPRIVHDITAYIFYITHDTNRNSPKPKQYIYKITSPYLPIWSVCIFLSVILAALLSSKPGVYMLIAVIGFNIFHYITEAITWKGGSLHRKYLAFKLD